MTQTVLHIGLPKTGTSFLQNWLDINQDRAGFRWIGTGVSHRIAAQCIGQSLQERSDIRKILQRPLDNLPADFDGNYVVSSEYFFHSEPHQVAQFFEDIGSPVSKIVCFLRRQDRWVASSHAQAIKATGETCAIIKAHHIEALDWNKLCARWREAHPSAVMVVLDYDAEHDRLLARFKAAIGANLSTDDDVPRQNESLNAEMTEVARMLNERSIPFDPSALLRVQHIGPRFALAREVVQQMEAIYAPSNKALAAVYPEISTLCALDWEPDGEDMTGKVSNDRLAEIMSKIVSDT